MKKLKSFPYHFLLVASFQILSLYAVNVNEADISAAAFILFLTVFLTALVFLVLLLITMDLQLSGIIATFYCVLFFIYGRLFDVIVGLNVGGLIIGRNKYLLPIYAVVTIAGTIWIFRSKWLKKSLTGITYLLNMYSLGLITVGVLLAATNFDWVSHGNKKNIDVINAGIDPARQVTPKRKIAAHHKPNVYFLIFDSYASPKVLRKYYGWDDHDFVDALRSRSFVVNENALSNYPFTMLSMNSYLNMDYIHEEPGFKNAKSKGAYLANRIRQNKVMAYFKSGGYDVIERSIGNERHKTRKEGNTLHSRVVSLFSNEFMDIVIHTSILYIIESELRTDPRRNATLSAIRDLIQSDVPKRPTFLYAHFICPHLPYIFRADGTKPKIAERVLHKYNIAIGYIEQIRFTGTKIIEIIDSIINRDPQAIIIVRADHGFGDIFGPYLEKREKPLNAFIKAQYGILSAIYLPPGVYMPEKSTPVNLFRYLFNALFDAKLEILPDKAFFTPVKEPFVFYDVTNELSIR